MINEDNYEIKKLLEYMCEDAEKKSLIELEKSNKLLSKVDLAIISVNNDRDQDDSGSNYEDIIDNEEEFYDDDDDNDEYEDIEDEENYEDIEEVEIKKEENIKKSEEREADNSKNETEKQQNIANKTVDIPHKGNFYEHDNRDDDIINDENKKKESNENDLSINRNKKLLVKPGNIEDKWSHDLFDPEYEEKSKYPKKQFKTHKTHDFQQRTSPPAPPSLNKEEPQILNKNSEKKIVKTKPLNLTDYLPKNESTVATPVATSATSIIDNNEQQNTRGHVLTRLKFPDKNEQDSTAKEIFLNKHRPIQKFQPQQQHQNRQNFTRNIKTEFENKNRDGDNQRKSNRYNRNNGEGDNVRRFNNNNNRFNNKNEESDHSRRFDNNRVNRQDNRFDYKQKQQQQDYSGENERKHYRNNYDKSNNYQYERNQEKNEDLRFKLQQQQQQKVAASSYEKYQKNQIVKNNDDENDLIDLTKTLSFSNSKYKKDVTRQNNSEDEQHQQNKYITQQKPQIPSQKPFVKPLTDNTDDRFIEKNQKFNQIIEPQFQIQNNRIHHQNYNNNNNNTINNANVTPYNINQFQEYLNNPSIATVTKQQQQQHGRPIIGANNQSNNQIQYNPQQIYITPHPQATYITPPPQQQQQQRFYQTAPQQQQFIPQLINQPQHQAYMQQASYPQHQQQLLQNQIYYNNKN